MNTDEIIRMAREAGISKYGLGYTCWEGHLERFAELVYAAGAANEREACAKVCEEGTGEAVQSQTLQVLRNERKRIATAIRARGNE